MPDEQPKIVELQSTATEHYPIFAEIRKDGRVQISFSISLNAARFWRSYASLGRFCDQITRLTEQLVEGEVVTEDVAKLAVAVEDDVRAMKPSVSEIHLQMREQLVAAGIKPLWDQNQGDGR